MHDHIEQKDHSIQVYHHQSKADCTSCQCTSRITVGSSLASIIHHAYNLPQIEMIDLCTIMNHKLYEQNIAQTTA